MNCTTMSAPPHVPQVLLSDGRRRGFLATALICLDKMRIAVGQHVFLTPVQVSRQVLLFLCGTWHMARGTFCQENRSRGTAFVALQETYGTWTARDRALPPA